MAVPFAARERNHFVCYTPFIRVISPVHVEFVHSSMVRFVECSLTYGTFLTWSAPLVQRRQSQATLVKIGWILGVMALDCR